MRRYDPADPGYLCFAAARRSFIDARSDPRRWLEECLARIAAREPEVQAFASIDLEGVRAAADASAKRYAAGAQCSSVDGLPVGIKDLYETEYLPTGMNSAYFKDWHAGRDAAHVHALRRGGALIVGKTVTTELGMAAPGPTRNPWDLRRTPGGSSSGSAAAVAAGMLPVASGAQVRGSIVRPASICGVIGNKPTFGALHGGGGFSGTDSIAQVGMLAGTLTDCWEVTHYIAHTVGGLPGHPGLYGEFALPAARRPQRLARQYTSGWDKTDARSQALFEGFVARLAESGVEIVEPESSPQARRYEELTQQAHKVLFDIMAWEGRWPLQYYAERRPDAFGPNVLGPLKRTASMTLADYRTALARKAELQAAHRAFAGGVDGFITLAHIGPGQIGLPPLGTPWYNDASSVIGAPAWNLPLLVADGVPLGVQLMGYEHGDEELAGIARWMLDWGGAGALVGA
ncbi:MAG: amidase [Betaproteobacteria bacterium]|nr:amidase [Betaproteobacteria bacterium]